MRQTILSSPNPSFDAIFGPEFSEIPLLSPNKSTFKLSLHYLMSDKNASRSVPVSTFKIPHQVTLADLEQILRVKFKLTDKHFLEFYYSSESDCVKKYLNTEEIYKIMENNGLTSVFNQDHEAEDVKELDIYYRIYAIKQKRQQRSRSQSEEEPEAKKKVSTGSKSKPASGNTKLKSSSSSVSTSPKTLSKSNSNTSKKQAENKNKIGPKEADEAGSTVSSVNKEAAKFSINSLL